LKFNFQNIFAILTYVYFLHSSMYNFQISYVIYCLFSDITFSSILSVLFETLSEVKDHSSFAIVFLFFLLAFLTKKLKVLIFKMLKLEADR